MRLDAEGRVAPICANQEGEGASRRETRGQCRQRPVPPWGQVAPCRVWPRTSYWPLCVPDSSPGTQSVSEGVRGLRQDEAGVAGVSPSTLPGALLPSRAARPLPGTRQACALASTARRHPPLLRHPRSGPTTPLRGSPSSPRGERPRDGGVGKEPSPRPRAAHRARTLSA